MNKYPQYPADAVQNPYTGHFVDSTGKKWFADEPDLEVGGVNIVAQRPP